MPRPFCKMRPYGDSEACQRFYQIVTYPGALSDEDFARREVIERDLVPALETQFMCPTCSLRDVVLRPYSVGIDQ